MQAKQNTSFGCNFWTRGKISCSDIHFFKLANFGKNIHSSAELVVRNYSASVLCAGNAHAWWDAGKWTGKHAHSHSKISYNANRSHKDNHGQKINSNQQQKKKDFQAHYFWQWHMCNTDNPTPTYSSSSSVSWPRASTVPVNWFSPTFLIVGCAQSVDVGTRYCLNGQDQPKNFFPPMKSRITIKNERRWRVRVRAFLSTCTFCALVFVFRVHVSWAQLRARVEARLQEVYCMLSLSLVTVTEIEIE